MNEEKINLIVNEVIRRIRLLLNTHRGLIVFRNSTDVEQINDLLKRMKDQGFIFDSISMMEEVSLDMEKALQGIQIDKRIVCVKDDLDIEKYDVVIVGNLTILEIERISHLKIENKFLYLVYGALKEGKLVYGFSKDLDIRNNDNLLKLASELVSDLEEIGLKIITRRMAPSCITMNQNVITLEDVKPMGKSKLRIHKNAMITSLARDYIKKNNIEIIRR